MNTISPNAFRLPISNSAADMVEQQQNPQNVPSFETTLKDFINDTNQLQQQSGKAAEALVSGQTNDIHQVMIMGEKSGIAFEMLMEVRNKLLESYQTMMRMQV